MSGGGLSYKWASLPVYSGDLHERRPLEELHEFVFPLVAEENALETEGIPFRC